MNFFSPSYTINDITEINKQKYITIKRNTISMHSYQIGYLDRNKKKVNFKSALKLKALYLQLTKKKKIIQNKQVREWNDFVFLSLLLYTCESKKIYRIDCTFHANIFEMKKHDIKNQTPN